MADDPRTLNRMYTACIVCIVLACAFLWLNHSGRLQGLLYGATLAAVALAVAALIIVMCRTR